jgi:hypothetical protein
MPITKNGIYGFLRNARDGGYESALGYLRSPKIWRLMPRLTHRLPIEDFEIHVLSGQARLTMALWMIASWMAATRRQWKFVIHDDGTLSSADVDKLAHVLPLCKVILSKDSNPAINEMLSGYPLCLRCRNLHPLGRKLFDIPLFAIQDKLLSIDTDIIFFSTPRLILQWISELGGEKSIFLEDAKDASLVSVKDARRYFNTQLTPNVNTGIIGIHKKILSLDFLEDCLARTGILDKDRWYIEQTLFALASSKFSKVELLPAEYVMALDSQCPTGAVARHYVGAVRHLFYSEGLAQARQMLKNKASLP